MQRLQIYRLGWGDTAGYICRTLKHLSLPLGDLVGMQIKFLAQLPH